MTVPMDRLAAALSDRYRIERELGQGVRLDVAALFRGVPKGD